MREAQEIWVIPNIILKPRMIIQAVIPCINLTITLFLRGF